MNLLYLPTEYNRKFNFNGKEITIPEGSYEINDISDMKLLKEKTERNKAIANQYDVDDKVIVSMISSDIN